VVTEKLTSLSKFCDMDTALKIINSQTLRWSAPHLFNDPFELSHKTLVELSKDALLKSLVMEALDRLFNPTPVKGRKNRLTETIDRWREEKRFSSEDEAESVLKVLLTKVISQQHIDQYIRAWKAFASAIRICCFTESPTNMAAWQRYGDNHSGIALKFKCGLNTTLSSPQLVSYTAAPPLVTSIKQQIDIAYGKEPKLSTANFMEKLLIKNEAIAAENEWRCFSKASDETGKDDELWYDNTKFPTHELEAVFLGLAITTANREQVIAMIKKNYKNTKIFKAETVPGKFAVTFAQVPKL